MARRHALNNKPINLGLYGKCIERVKTAKLLGLKFQDHLDCKEHITDITSSCYATLAFLRKLKSFNSLKLRKQLVESLVISKLDYWDTVFYLLHKYIAKRLQRVQNACAGFVTNNYCRINVIEIGWLPIKERREWHILKLARKAMHETTWPSYVNLELVSHLRSLRSDKARLLKSTLESGTFQDSASKLVNNVLPELRRILLTILFF